MVRSPRVSSFFQRKIRARRGLLAPHVYFDAIRHPRRYFIPASPGASGYAPGTAEGGAVSSRGRCDPVAGCWRPVYTFCAVWHPRRCPTPALRDPSGYALVRHSVAFLGIVVPATPFVARLMIIPILRATRSARICSAFP
jgi:hypothetical protein